MKKAFTLIELLVVISIIGILATLVINNLSDARARARDSQRKTNLSQLKTALRLYYNDNQKYPTDSDSIGTPGGIFESSDANTVYMTQLPEEFTYQSADGDNFTLIVTLENASDADLLKTQTRCAGTITFEPTDYVICGD